MDGLTHDNRLDKMRRRFPKIKAWPEWWTMADVEAILFSSRRTMLEDLPNGNYGLPSLTNAQESMHQVYYMLRYVYFFLDYMQFYNGSPLQHGEIVK
jgi:hypothetical protein